MRLLAWVDGGARGNPGPAGYGILLQDETGREKLRAWGFLGSTTNNVAEYRGLIAAIEAALGLGARRLVVRTDSELIERQVSGVYKVRKPHLQELIQRVRTLAGGLDEFRVVHVPREQNCVADALANRAMDEQRSGQEIATEGP